MSSKPAGRLVMFGGGGALLAVVAVAAVWALAQSSAPATPTQAPVAALVSHEPGVTHSKQPKRLEAVAEIDMSEMYFAHPKGAQNPTFRLTAGKTLGIHIHNEGNTMHELVIGRKLKDGEYTEILTELIPVDVFFYYDQVKAEVGGAKFEELELDPGLRDIWIRMKIPAELKGEWEIGCFAEGHYDAGMHAKLIVE